MISVLLKDFYKASHIHQYPKGTEVVYSNFTPRISRVPWINEVVVFGIQYFLQRYLVEEFNENFFSLPEDYVVQSYNRMMTNTIGPIDTSHIRALHKLGYLPIEIKALPEGTVAPLRIPVLTIKNTLPEFYWVTNFLETQLSNVLWHPMTSATIAYQYKKLLKYFAYVTSDIPEFTQWQGHDFSMRGHTSLESSMVSGGAHLLSFTGTDTIPSIAWLEKYYEANCEKELIGASVPATEHSVMCFGGKESEIQTYRRLLTEVHPEGIVSIVSDTWDYWKVIAEILPQLRELIMAREGKLVIRPDSGDPEKIICGDDSAPLGSPAFRGTIDILWDIFGGTTNSKGYRQLDPHIGIIYGDSITFEKCQAINKNLEQKKFASTNVVYGIGSYTYQYVTRDTLGFAMKATWGKINGQSIEVFKAPLTDSGAYGSQKKSAKGLLKVDFNFQLLEGVSEEEEKTGMLQTVFKDGKITRTTSLAEIRMRLK